MSQVKAFSLLTEEEIDLGIKTESLDDLLELGEMAATGHDNLIVYVSGPALQKWESAT